MLGRPMRHLEFES